MAWPELLGGYSLAKVVAEGGKADGQFRGDPARLLQHHQGVDAGVDLRVPLGRGGDAKQRINLWEQRLQGAALAQHLDKDLRGRPQQHFFQLLPDSLRREVGQLASGRHLAHQGEGFRRYGKALSVEAGGEAGDPQDAQRIFGKGGGDVAQQPFFQILDATVGIVELALIIFGDGVDGEIPAQQILLQRHIGGGVADKAGVALTLFAFGTGEGILLLGFGVKKHGKVATDLGKTQRQHLFHGGADHQMIPVALRQSQQAIPHCAPNQISLQTVSPVINRGAEYIVFVTALLPEHHLPAAPVSAALTWA